MVDLHPAQAATDPWAPGISYNRFVLDRVTRNCNWWLGKLRRGEPVMVDGRNVTLETERANTKLRETGGLSREKSAREQYGILGT